MSGCGGAGAYTDRPEPGGTSEHLQGLAGRRQMYNGTDAFPSQTGNGVFAVLEEWLGWGGVRSGGGGGGSGGGATFQIAEKIEDGLIRVTIQTTPPPSPIQPLTPQTR